MRYTQELLIQREATLQQYLELPSLQLPAQIGAPLLEHCLQEKAFANAEQSMGLASCAFDLAQLHAMADRTEKAEQYANQAERLAYRSRLLLERYDQQSWYYLDDSYRLEAFLAQVPYATDTCLWNTDGQCMTPNAHVYSSMRALFEPIQYDRSTMKPQRSGWLPAERIGRRVLRQIETEIALTLLLNSPYNQRRGVAMLANSRERHPTGIVSDAFDIKYLLPDDAWIPVRVLPPKARRTQEPHPNISEVSPETVDINFNDVIEMLNAKPSGAHIKRRRKLLTQATDSVHEYIRQTPRLSLRSLGVAYFPSFEQAVETS